jgi:hypothetical protein
VDEIRAILNEGRRVAIPAGRIFVAFYRLSGAQEQFLASAGLLSDSVLSHRRSLELYLLNPVQMVDWVAKQARVGKGRALAMILRVAAGSTLHEKAITFRMQRIFRNREIANALINAAPEKQPYRNETEIRGLFTRLGILIQGIQSFPSCYVVEATTWRRLKAPRWNETVKLA